MDTKIKENMEIEVLPEIKTHEVIVIEKASNELDFKDRTSIIYFGSSAQEKLDDISNSMIDGVQSKDLGKAGESLTSLVSSIRGFDLDALDPNQKVSIWQKIMGKGEPLAEFIQGYESVRDQIDIASNELEKQKSQLMKDIVSLDKLYDANLDYLRNLELYIITGEDKLKELEENVIPKYITTAEESKDMLEIQELKEIRGFSDDLERRVHDLRLSRQVSLQALPSIRLIQENDKSLIGKITSTLVNTVPLWRNQLAQTVAIFRSHKGAKALKDATDLTNELLERNAEGLRDANSDIRTQMERGIFDISSIKKANETLIATLNDSLQIANEGKKARKEALVELDKSERELKDALIAVKVKAKEALLEAPNKE
ncbi:MAG: toxic anion resistance protein [Sulfurovum sp.]|nr:toxic anion resistance protein [Sulfurovaceae bacterium]